MSDELKQFIISLYQDIPQEVYEGLLSVFCLVPFGPERRLLTSDNFRQISLVYS